MIIDGITLVEGSEITNFTGAKGTSFPASPDISEMFFRTDLNEFYVYETAGWTKLGTAGELSSHSADTALHITSNQNTFLDALNLPTLTGTEVNYMAGVTSAVQTQLNDKVSKSGDTMTGLLTLSANPSSGLQAATKQYVDAITLTSATWKNPIKDPDIQDVVSAKPTLSGSVGQTFTYIKFGGTQGASWNDSGTTVSPNDGDVVQAIITNATGPVANWTQIQASPLTAGDRYGIAFEHGTIGATLSGVGFVNDDIIQYVSGNPNLFASWSLPEGRGAGGSGTELVQGTTVLVSDPESYHYGHTYLYDAVGNSWLEIAGPGSVGAGSGLSYTGTTLNVGAGTGITVATDTIALDTSYTDTRYVNTAGDTMTGTLTMNDLLLSTPEIKDYAITHTAPTPSAGAVTFDYTTGQSFAVSITANITSITLSNPPATGKYGEIVIKFSNTGAFTVTGWPASVKWAGAAAPVITSGAGKVDFVTLRTIDAGTTWYGDYSQNYA